MRSIKTSVAAFFILLACFTLQAQTGTKTAVKPKPKVTVKPKPLAKNQVIWNVESELADCDGTPSKKCLLVKPPSKKAYELFYDPIQGFDYVEGYRYTIMVQVDSIKNAVPPAPAAKYTLIKVMSKVAVKQPLDANVKIWQISEETTECEDVTGKHKCLLYKEPSGKFFEMLHEPIEGFAYEPGTAYTIHVKVTAIPGDAGRPMTYKYKLVKIVSQTKSGVSTAVTPAPIKSSDKANTPMFTSEHDSTGLSDHIWYVQLFRVDTIAYDVRDLKMSLMIHTDQGRIGGKASCNNYFAGLTYDKKTFILQPIGSTKMYCDNMKAEEDYFKILQQCDNYELSNGILYLKKGEKALIELR